MKRLAYFASALALCGLSFTACDKNGNGSNLDDVIEDGFYVAGAATGVDNIAPEYMMTAGINEASGSKRDGMFEKYIALKANQEFELLLYKAGTKVRYSADLKDTSTDTDGDGTAGDDNQPTVTLRKGTLVTGADAPAMTVAKDGLYHIVLDLNTEQDLSEAQIILAPVSWGVRGINSDWGWKEMTASEFNQKTMTWTIEYDLIRNCDFKFAYGGGWKIQLDDAGNVKAHTNLGKDCVNGGDNILTGSAYKPGKITLTWNLKGGEIKNGYSFAIEGTPTILDPATYSVGFSGSCFAAGDDNGWGDPVDSRLAICDKDKSTVKDQTSLAGTYVYNITDLAFAVGEFKIRFDGGWFGIGNSELKVTGIEYTGTDNFTIAAAGTYDVEFTVEYDGVKATSIKVVFTKK